jgi:hypothetical protein
MAKPLASLTTRLLQAHISAHRVFCRSGTVQGKIQKPNIEMYLKGRVQCRNVAMSESFMRSVEQHFFSMGVYCNLRGNVTDGRCSSKYLFQQMNSFQYHDKQNKLHGF